MERDTGLEMSNPRIVWLDRVSSLMDNRFRIPFTNIRFGLDFLIGLAPGIGDIFSLAISGALVLGMVRYGAGGRVLLLMLGNILLDTIVGSVPVLGDIFDLTYRSNRRNFELFRAHHNEGKNKGSGCGMLLAVLFVLILLLGLAVWSFLRVATWVLS
ncbi:MAG: DUF4112 domain-containing protein [Saprospirales bacterium]|nr:DUF4112 domain-containing protein [Saprospirales bacterium]MBK8491614.1 DUF4112 domain-containing protein [Saprospirales bacterium]